MSAANSKTETVVPPQPPPPRSSARPGTNAPKGPGGKSTPPPQFLGQDAAEAEDARDVSESLNKPGWFALPGRIISSLKSSFSGENRRNLPALLVSLIFHTTLLLLLALITWQRAAGLKDDGALIGELIADSADPVQIHVLSAGENPPPPSTAVSDSTEQAQPASSFAEIGNLLDLEAILSEQTDSSELQSLLSAASIAMDSTFASTGVEGRSPDKRQELALARGGTLESEKAVEDALDWLAEHQRPNGSWSLVHDQGVCNGRCANPGSPERYDTAATGLSLLAFLGAGYTHLEGKHKETVRAGVYFLKQVMEDTPEGSSLMYGSDRGMYNHGIASFAFCEAYQLTDDPDLKRAAQQTVDFIVNAQHYQRGWGYRPKQPGDLTVSGWQIMALKSGFSAGLDVPPSTMARIDIFRESQQSAAGPYYGYGKPGSNSTCTAIGNLIRMFRGETHTHPHLLEAAHHFLRKGHSNGDIYNNYYVTLFLFHMGEPFWSTWNPKMRDHLVKTQAQEGHEAGSWYFNNMYGQEGGRLYTTAMAAMTLEVYYRYSPIYQQKDEHFEF